MKKFFLSILTVLLLVIGYRSIAFVKLIEIFEINDPDDLFEPFDFFYNETVREMVSLKMEEVILETTVNLEDSEVQQWKEWSFSLPREDKVFIEEGEQSLQIYFENGSVIRIILIFEEDLLPIYKNDFPAIEYLSSQFAEMGIETAYDLQMQAYKAQPEDVHWWDSNGNLLRKLSLLKVKELLMLIKAPYYFAHFEMENVKGFQACSVEIPECEESVVTLLFTDENEDYHYNLVTEGLTQDELNAFLLSIQAL